MNIPSLIVNSALISKSISNRAIIYSLVHPAFSAIPLSFYQPKHLLTSSSSFKNQKMAQQSAHTGDQGELKNQGDEKDSSGHFILKTPKGMRDIGPDQAWNRKRVFDVITNCFECHGAQPLDTPVCERREILQGNYGEDAKLIYNLEDQGGEMLSLRYDLTVPFARYLGQNKVQAMTRYHIAKVYRRDNPSITKGRFREFYQCDIDFAGKYDTMMADSECLEILCEILNKIKLPHNFEIKINHRCILNGMFRISGVPEDKFKTICSSIDKLDKMSWEDVKKEMTNEKGLDENVANIIGTYVVKSGGSDLIEELMQNKEFAENSDAKKGLEELRLLYKYAENMGIHAHLKFDLSLARGLDYYTGLIFEAVVLNDQVEVGSIAAGGRYDNLVSSLLDNPSFNVPCVGLSIGIERLFAILESQKSSEPAAAGDAQIHCCIGSIGKEMSVHRYKIINALRERGIRVKNVLKDSVKPLVLYQTCEKEDAPYAIFFGAKDLEQAQPIVCLRTMETRTEEKVEIDKLADLLEEKLKIKKS